MTLRPAHLSKIHIEDAFWSRYIGLVRTNIIPYQWDVMNDRIPGVESSHCIENFRIAAGDAAGEFYGAVFQDTDVAKWLEAVGYSLAAHPDPALEAVADEAIDLICRAQQPDGYINTYFTLKEPEKRWSNLREGHELYTAGHLMEAAVAYCEGTGKRRLLDALCKFADLICQTFGKEEGKIHGYPGHQEVEIGLVKLYRQTKRQRYLDAALYFIDARGVGENYFLEEMARPGMKAIFPELTAYFPAYSQSHQPVREQKTAEGHAVRAVYMCCAMADLAELCEDETLLESCKTLWNNIVTRRMYITGGIGSSGILERFTTDYDLPNDYNYAESCASIGLALFGLRMARVTGEAAYLDVVERALYNTVLAGIAMDGKSFFYVNPLEVWPQACLPRTSKEHVKPLRQKWFGVACCPPNIARTLASMGQYIYSLSDDCLYVNLFVSNESDVEQKDATVHVKLETRFPVENRFTLTVSGIPGKGMEVALRIPGYACHYEVQVDGSKIPYEAKKGFAVVRLERDAVLDVAFEAPARFVRANPSVRADAGKVAVMRGPLVYCFEEADNGDHLSSVVLDTMEALSEEFEPALLGGTVTVTVRGKRLQKEGWPEQELYGTHTLQWEEARLKAIPYAYWCNRGGGEMAVWMRERMDFG